RNRVWNDSGHWAAWCRAHPGRPEHRESLRALAELGSSSVQLRNSGATRWARSLPRLRGRVGVGANSLCSSCEPPPCPSPASGGGDAVASGRRDHRIRVMTATSAIPARWSLRAPTGDTFARVITGLLILVLWEGIARTYAPPYVARPTGVLA